VCESGCVRVCVLRATDFKVKMCELREHDGVSRGAVVGEVGGRGGGNVEGCPSQAAACSQPLEPLWKRGNEKRPRQRNQRRSFHLVSPNPDWSTRRFRRLGR